MVRLDRIYTRGGDKGMTSLGDGTRVPKTHPRIAAYGTVDELNSVLGVVVQQRGLGAADRALLRRIQNDLFDVGADLCVPRTPVEPAGKRLRVTPGQVEALEKAIDLHNAPLPPLASFILPGGTPASAWLHVARTVCRRAELDVARLFEMHARAVEDQTLVYLNRLSDLLFVLARFANDRAKSDVLWQPGAGMKSTPLAGSASREAASPARGRKRSPARPVRRRRG